MSELKADLVLEGGGVKGIALVGAVSVLAEQGYSFPRVAGTSAGSIVGAFIASGMPVGQVVDLVSATDYSRFRDKGWEDRIPLLGPAASLLAERGIYEGKYLVQYLEERLPEDRRTFADYRIEDSASALPPEQRYRLLVMATDITLRRLVRLPWDYPTRYGLDADSRRISEAVRASMSIPFFYEPARITYEARGEGRRQERTSLLVDGGVLSNFPVEAFDQPAGVVPRWPTFGIKLSSRTSNLAMPAVPDGPLATTMALLATLTSARDAAYVDRPDVQARTVFVDTFGVSATDFDLDAATRDRLFESGRAAATAFLESWDFDAYVAKFRSTGAAGDTTATVSPSASG